METLFKTKNTDENTPHDIEDVSKETRRIFLDNPGSPGMARKDSHTEYLISIPQQVKDYILRHGESRLGGHLKRLLTSSRSGIENQFGIALAELLSEDPTCEKKYGSAGEKMLDVALGEGDDTVMFWTFAPYLYDSLINKRITPEEAMRFIAEWASNGKAMSQEVNLPGLKQFCTDTHGQSSTYILPTDTTHPLHLLTKERASWIIDHYEQQKQQSSPTQNKKPIESTQKKQLVKKMKEGFEKLIKKLLGR
jgi:hypothetical protein